MNLVSHSALLFPKKEEIILTNEYLRSIASGRRPL